jgi:fibronectin-binding autotransporter adhesin
VNVGQGATMQVNNSSLTGAVNLNGGLLYATGGLNDFGSAAISGSALNPNTAAGALRGSLHVGFVNPSGGFGTDLGTFNTLTRTPQFTANLNATTFPQAFTFNATQFAGNGDLAFGTRFNADGAFAGFFGTATANTDVFTATFTGKFTADATGPFTFGKSINDDGAAVWVDLNQNGLFETNGSAGNERVTFQDGCCGQGDDPNATDNGVVNLIGGQSYGVAVILQDTGGGSSLAAKWAPGAVPTGNLANFINPGAQSSFWSVDAPTGGGLIRLDAGSELRAGSITNATTVAFAGPATLQLSGLVTSSLETMTNLAGTGTSTLNLAGTLNVGRLTVAPGTTFVKNGGGTLTAANQSLGNGGTLQINAGTVNLQGTTAASAGAANGGGVVVNGTATLNIAGAISGAVTVNSGGTLGGIGSVGATTIASGGILAPGNSPGTITTGNLVLNGTLQEEIASALSYDITVVNGTVDLTGGTLSLAVLNPSQLQIGDKLFIVQNDGADLITGTFAGLADNATFTTNGIEFQITYDADFATLGLDGGNDVALAVLVPEPNSFVALIGGLGVLACARRFRRRH